MMCKIVRFQKLMWRNMIWSTKSKKVSVLHYSINLACVWILYLKVISRIFMYRMHFAKNLRCLVRILDNAKYIIGRMHFANSHF